MGESQQTPDTKKERNRTGKTLVPKAACLTF